MNPVTPSQTTGPYFGLALTAEHLARLVDDGDPGAIFINGTLTDGSEQPVREGMVEIWQANQHGRYSHPEDNRYDVPMIESFQGFGRCHTEDDGSFSFVTVKPGRVPAVGGGLQAPHINIAVFGVGLLKPLRTRIYFSDEEEANESDPLLSGVDPDRRHLLVARLEGVTARFDIRLQGPAETPFFDV